MSNEEEIPLLECSICGKDGGPTDGCNICHGNQNYVRPRQFTLSDVRSGRVKEPSRYGLDGDVGPKQADPLWAGADQRR